MLRDLRVQQFALFDDVRISFGPRLNVLTGETGAGKSILLDALMVIRGGRASSDLIRSGCDEAIVEASFSVETGADAARELAAMGYPADDEVVVQRVISASGKGRVYVNGRPVPVATLAQITGHLIDLHSQHEHQSLTRADTPLLVLDAYARLDELKGQLRATWSEWSALQEAATSRATRESVRRREATLLAHEVEELIAANLRLGEWDDLERERAVLRNAERLMELSRAASDRLQSSDGVLEESAKIAADLAAGAAIDAKLAEAASLADSALVHFQELAAALRTYTDDLGHEEGRLDGIESRLASLQQLRRKYNVPLADLPALLEAKRQQLSQLEQEAASDDTLIPRTAEARRRLEALADELHARRAEASARIEALVDAELERLGMSARLRVAIAPFGEEGAIGSQGRDRVDFLLQSNPGEPEKPLRKIASGGELSRVMLALKSVLASVDSVPTLIFDEADAGVGGAVAEVVGRRLRAVSAYRQVLCVTHLPQVASGADTHILVEKSIERGRTRTAVRHLADRERVREIARMLAGETITATALRHAEEMIRLVSSVSPEGVDRSERRARQSGSRPLDARA